MQEKMDIDNSCLTDSICDSDRCDRTCKCANKLNEDNRCWNNGDCKSSYCQYFFTDYFCA